MVKACGNFGGVVLQHTLAVCSWHEKLCAKESSHNLNVGHEVLAC